MFACPVCGFDELTEPPYDVYGCASFDICPCCGTEFGNDDFGKSHEVLRENWINSGMKWHNRATSMPANYDPHSHLVKVMSSSELALINQAITLYLGYGVAASPRSDKAKIEDIFGQTKAALLVREISSIFDAVNQVPIDWDNTNLVSAGNMVRLKIHEQYPELDNHALNALVWKFTFDWR